jgi:uncharacterized membrane protein YhaH (DUF805 family)
MMHLLFGFQGRIRRTHYWLAALGSSFALSALLMIFLMILSLVGATPSTRPDGQQIRTMSTAAVIILMVLTLAYLVLLFWIGLAIQVKRWHDRDKSGVWVLIGFIPMIGPIWALVECGFLDGTQGPNRYGPSPKGLGGPEHAFG